MSLTDLQEVERLAERFDPTQDPHLSDPYPLYAEAQAAARAFYSPALGHWVITRYHDIRHILETPEIFSAANSMALLQPICPEASLVLLGARYRPVRGVLSLDPPQHARLRRHAQAGFVPRRIAGLEPLVRGVAVQLVNQFASRGNADLVSELAWELPGLVIFQVLGIPDGDVERIKQYSLSRRRLTWSRPTEAVEVELAHQVVELWRYCETLVARRSQEPGANLLSDLLQADAGHGSALTVPEMTTLAFDLLSAGHDTTAVFLSNAFRHLLAQPDSWQAICRDAALIPNAVEELLRLDGSIHTTLRRTRRAVNLSGVPIPADASLLLLVAAANHDPSVFEDPDRFDIHRANAREHLSFGYGTHYCLGASLGRLEARVALEEVSTRLPQLRLIPGQALHFFPSWRLRGSLSLLVEWDAEAVLRAAG